jgi:hypothetical protein
MENKQYPLILVFYVNRETLSEPYIANIFVNSVNDTIAARDANAMAFIVPTDGEEKIDCINPVQLSEPDMTKIYNTIDDLKKNFDIGQGADEGINDEANEVELD